MGFFSKTQEAAGGLSPLTKDRIKERLDARGSSYGVDSDGDIGGYWDGHLFYFFIVGGDEEILQIRGRWNREIDPGQFDALVTLANQFNTDKLFPKAYVRKDDEGKVHVFAEHTVDYEHGATDEQLDLHFGSAIGSTVRFFEQLDELYPTEAAAGKAEFEKE